MRNYARPESALGSMTKRLVYICDWLPPDFGAVGQYAVLFARRWASEGWDVILVGLTGTTTTRQAAEPVGPGSLEIRRIYRRTYQKQKFVARVAWTIISNLALLRAAFAPMRRADAILFTGSPPLMVHFIGPLNLLLRKKLIYRITDFHPECLIAERGRVGAILDLLLRLTTFWRRRIDEFEVLGHDQAQRLVESGIARSRIRLKPDPSPVIFEPGLAALPLPDELRGGAGVILYSGNWGVAHDDATFIEAYARYARRSPDGLKFWLNATGAKADRVEQELRVRNVPLYRSELVPLEELPRLLMAVDVHLVTLRDSFVGYVLPSKIHACIDSGKRILFIGSESSDVHLLAARTGPHRYWRVSVADVDELVHALHALESSVVSGPSLVGSAATKAYRRPMNCVQREGKSAAVAGHR
jgi:hypothetical protein